MNDTEKLMKKCQTGDGRWPDAANNLLAECYGHFGKLIVERQRAELECKRLRQALYSISDDACAAADTNKKPRP